jgi:predicted ATP-grasp superfamily ATP-dependent carboligase
MDCPELVDFLLRLADDHGYRGWMLFPMQDDAVELVSHHTTALQHGFVLTTPAWPILRRVHDKRLAHEVADRVGVSRPRTFYPADAADLARLDIEYPVIIKPTISISMQRALNRKVLVARGDAELAVQYEIAASAMPADLLMVQELIPGNGQTQFSVAAFSANGEMLTAMSARRTRQFPYDFGRSSSFVEMVDRPDLLELTARLLRDAGISGMLEVEFKHDFRDGLDKVLDINVRPWGWHHLCIAAGVDFPYLQYCWAMGEPLPQIVQRDGYAWRRLLTDVPAGIQEIRAGIITPAAYLHSFYRRRTAGSVWDLSDPLPALADPAVTLMRVSKPWLSARWNGRPGGHRGTEDGLAPSQGHP